MSLAPRVVRGAMRLHARASPRFPASTAVRASTNSLPHRSFHSTHRRYVEEKPTSIDPKLNAATEIVPPRETNFGKAQFADFNLKGRAFIVTGGAQGLGLSIAEALAEAGGKGEKAVMPFDRSAIERPFNKLTLRCTVYCLDRQENPHEEYAEALARVVPEWGGSLVYRQADVVDTERLDKIIAEIADENQRLDGCVAAAGVQQITPAADYTVDDVNKMLAINYTGVFMTATSVARQMFKYKSRGSICFIASMSGLIANHGLLSPVYNSSKAAVIQLARNLAMEWSPITKEGTGGVRVNCISPGHIMTPMVEKNFEEVPGLKEEWESLNMFGRLAEPREFKGAALFLMGNASTFMTGSNMVIDGGHTAW
ncbi:Putative short-chain dehydrogenase/reductase SDR, NAD(P)-binding domain superfamily [Colletotrichum destructivum]|uniref:Short-chain dehydrogenase/reductase SDR, NAD(P)-binding domain superfamily n=1 Tax=Colletotrichum destructivum TaxID=34406 RepID=A0AAX4ICM7_9PEZI|nr:Putative short-chain dehydrogenase/reductase SDR, NAD(P)-binding domain superfamily [Colletotrichum destructivum]